jgi:hypothetical protein
MQANAARQHAKRRGGQRKASEQIGHRIDPWTAHIGHETGWLSNGEFDQTNHARQRLVDAHEHLAAVERRDRDIVAAARCEVRGVEVFPQAKSDAFRVPSAVRRK